MSPFVREDFVEIDRFDASLSILHSPALRWRLDLIRQDHEVDSTTLACFVESAVLVRNHSSLYSQVQHAWVEPPFGGLADATNALEHCFGCVQMHELPHTRTAHEIERASFSVAEVTLLLDAVTAEAIRPVRFQDSFLDAPLQLRFIPCTSPTISEQLLANLFGMTIVVCVRIVDAINTRHGEEGRNTSGLNTSCINHSFILGHNTTEQPFNAHLRRDSWGWELHREA